MKSWARIAFLTVVAAQLVFLIGFIGIRETALFTGTEVVLQTVPVDPRSLLQGDYAILDYEIATLPGYMETRGIGETVYVELRRAGRTFGQQADYSVWPGNFDGEIFIKGRIDDRGRLDFGIGTYFVPEGTGRIIERAQDVRVVVSVDDDGNAVIKDVLVDGSPSTRIPSDSPAPHSPASFLPSTRVIPAKAGTGEAI